MHVTRAAFNRPPIKETDRRSKILTAAVVAFAIGAGLYWLAAREGAPYQASAGWYLAILVGGAILSDDGALNIRLGWTLVPWLCLGYLDAQTLKAAQAVAQQPTAPVLREYLFASGEFTALMFIWIVCIFYWHRSGDMPDRLRYACRVALFLVGCIFGTIEIYRTTEILRSSTLSILQQFHWLKEQTSMTMLFLYVLFVIQLGFPRFFPLFLSRNQVAGGPRYSGAVRFRS
jgi:hypothetical protein